ncbi:MAG TPA: hypothetical protein VFC67_14965 [Prolixibacteraceae bacterium]|nr:hypothetical protein [Prolixibacteraceae bacterium]
MNELLIPEKKIKVNYPSSWDEIKGENVCRIGEIMHDCYMGKIDYDMARKLAADEFLNRVNSDNKPALDEGSVDFWSTESLLADSVDFLFNREEMKDGNENVSINPKFCTQLVPWVKVGLRWYIGPKDLLSDLTIFEFKEASWRIGKYSETRDDQYLNEIFAVLYQPGGLIGKRRLRSAIIETHSRASLQQQDRNYRMAIKAATHVPIGLKFMIYLFFIGCMNWLREEAVEIDGNEIRFGCLFPKSRDKTEGGASMENDTGMAGILFQMAESGVFGNMEQTSKVSMWDVFLRLLQIHNQIKKMK